MSPKILTLSCVAVLTIVVTAMAHGFGGQIGSEKGVSVHLKDGEEQQIPLRQLIAFGESLFVARFTSEDGLGRPQTKGTGSPLSDPSSPLVFPRNSNRISGPESQSCAACHNLPRAGGGGDRVGDVFVMAQRFDFATFDRADSIPTRGTMDEAGTFATLQNIADERKTVGMFGSGYIEMLARQMTADLEATCDRMPAGTSASLVSKGVPFGVVTRRPDGTWDTSRVHGISALSLATTGPNDPPSMVIRPFAQASNVISLRQFTNNALNQHHGMQSEERFGLDVDADGDGMTNEMTAADVTALTLFQATLPPPGQIISNDPAFEHAVSKGQQIFSAIGCASCHIPALPLTSTAGRAQSATNSPELQGKPGWIYSEPSPYNPSGNLRPGPVDYPNTASPILVDLTSDALPGPRLKPVHSPIGEVVWVPAYTDMKLHDLCAAPDDPDREPIDQNQPPGSPAFFGGNCYFLTRHLWGLYNSGPFMHNGLFSTMRDAIEHHNGEALASHRAFDALDSSAQDDLIEFLKSFQVLPAGAKSLVIDENGQSRHWPPGA
ncbi:MAG: di-heme oxidoredictase family protein [Candidatus Acidiferrales bacterium]